MSNFKYYDVKIKEVVVNKNEIFATSPFGALQEVFEEMSKVRDLDFTTRNGTMILYDVIVNEKKTAEFEKNKQTAAARRREEAAKDAESDAREEAHEATLDGIANDGVGEKA